MNYYNPYYMFTPMMNVARPSLFSALRNSFSAINFGSIVNNTQKTLNIVNQAIPLVKQVTPVVKNAKTMFRVMNEFKKNTGIKNNYSNQTNTNKNNYSNEYGPTFFL